MISKTSTRTFTSAVVLLAIVAVSTAQDCFITVPANPLSAQGLATPYRISGDGCTQTDPCTASFVEVTVLNLDTGALATYAPLVLDEGMSVVVPPVVPQLPAHYVAGIWFGTNGNTLTLVDTNASLVQGQCVNGLPGSIFGQFAFCNAVNFFAQANALIAAGKLKVPPLGYTPMGEPCPTTRSFGVVDQDQSDNVVVTYLLTADGVVLQDTTANHAAFPTAQVVGNGSDNRLLDEFMLPALNCKSFEAPSLADPTQMKPSLAMNELSAATIAMSPEVALVPLTDPMTVVNGEQSLAKTNLYRVGVNQPVATSASLASGFNYCLQLRQVGSSFLIKYQAKLALGASPDPAMGNNLFNFLGARYIQSYANLDCQNLLQKPVPVTQTLDANGVAIHTVIIA